MGLTHGESLNQLGGGGVGIQLKGHLPEIRVGENVEVPEDPGYPG